jgi:hypothetical protein
VSRRSAIADGFDALAGAARAVHDLRAMREDVVKRATVASLSSSVRRIESQLQKAEQSFAAISKFCEQAAQRLEILERQVTDLVADGIARLGDSGSAGHDGR